MLERLVIFGISYVLGAQAGKKGLDERPRLSGTPGP